MTLGVGRANGRRLIPLRLRCDGVADRLVGPLGIRLLAAQHEQAGHAVTTLFRGLPELLTLFLVYFGGQQVMRWVASLLGFAGAWQLDGFLAGVIAQILVFPPGASRIRTA